MKKLFQIYVAVIGVSVVAALLIKVLGVEVCV